ncbi:hypothetical protein J3D55_003017 [Chryseobacterium ginsenosidimutans]|nr:PH domain-containing protein [Chryseobacterium ginsenosidimutans]MCS3870101.1 hypothetical protein [Chryseobacterium ginsenosidimutans]
MSEKSRLDEIKDELEKLDINPTFFARKEIHELPNVLSQDEKIVYLVEGRNKTTTHHIVLVATDRRLIFIDKEMFYGLKVEDFSYDKVTSIQYEKEFMLASIDINVSSDIVEIDGVGKYEAELFCEKVRDFMSRPKEYFQAKAETDSFGSIGTTRKIKGKRSFDGRRIFRTKEKIDQ